MLREKQPNHTEPPMGSAYSRLFSDSEHLLTVCYDQQEQIIRFDLVLGLSSEDKQNLTWSESSGLNFSAVDSGETTALENQSPITTKRLKLDTSDFHQRFIELAEEIDPEITRFIEAKLK